MKNKLFALLVFALCIALLSILTRNIYLLGLSELICIPTSIVLFRMNLKQFNPQITTR